MIRVSFIVVAYNEERTIERCLTSIVSQNNLTDYEVVVVDDGSKDATAHIVEEYARKQKNSCISLRRLIPNQGRGAARATGVEAARGEYIAFIDSDIVLPADWLSTCFHFMPEYDAVGGVAVPDGDVNYLYAFLNLKPKRVNPTTLVSGSNGLYKREIFEKISFNRDLRDGEDSVFNKAMIAGGFKIRLIKSLIVEHREARKFTEALRWLYQTGRGATRQFKQFGEFRLPDIAYFTLLGITAFSLFFTVWFDSTLFLVTPFLFVLLVDVIHMRRKFFFEFLRPCQYIAGIFIYWLLLISYFLGRTAGWFVSVPKTQQRKKVMVCFDFEGSHGMPFEAKYNLEETTNRLLTILDTHHVRAVFFVVGKIIEENPELIQKIAEHGHEIAIHGYAHEHLNTFTPQQLGEFGNNLSRVEDLLETLTGKRPMGFRSPYLMAPKFYSKSLYDLLLQHGYRWVSNREICFSDELFRPDRINMRYFWGKNNWFTKILSVILNLRMIFTESVTIKKGMGGVMDTIRWFNAGTSPFKRDDLFEVPVHAPLDCDLLGLPNPHENTSDRDIRYATEVFLGGIKRNGLLYSITFHDWIIGTENRVEILERVLESFSKKQFVSFTTTPIE